MRRRAVRIKRSPSRRTAPASWVGDERGTIIIVTAVLIVALLGMTAIVVDIGNARSQKRHLTTATDSGALAAAGIYAAGGDGCSEAVGYVTASNPDAVLSGGWCTHSSSGTRGIVTVEAEEPVSYAFAPFLGIGDTTVRARTLAAYDVPAFVSGGLRPFGLCLDAMNSFEQWSTPLAGSTGLLPVPYGKDDHPEACNGDENVPGNWGIMDFNRGSNPLGDTRDWIRDGYDGEVFAGQMGQTCDQEPEFCIDGDPGAWSSSLESELNYLISTGTEFTLPIFDSGGANGNNAEFHIVGFVTARLHGYVANGPAAERNLTIEFMPGVTTGGLGDGSGLDTGTRVIAMCGVGYINNC